MTRNSEYVWINSDLLDCEHCRSMSKEEHMTQFMAALKGAVNHMSTHMAFPIDDGDDEQPSLGVGVSVARGED